MPNSATMLESVLIAADTVLTAKGDSPVVPIQAVESRAFLLTLKITEAVEQEYLEIWLQGSSDGTTWAATPLATLPQCFYPGEYPTLVDLSADTATQYLRVHWELSRWGRGDLTPRFVAGLTLREVPRELLQEARLEALGRRRA